VAVASAGPYASLHLAADKYPRQHPTTQFFYGPDALPATQPTASKKLLAKCFVNRVMFIVDEIEFLTVDKKW